MQELLNDPETIPFTNGKRICLGLLNKDINRRVIKIRSMIEGRHYGNGSNTTKPKLSNKFVQT